MSGKTQRPRMRIGPLAGAIVLGVSLITTGCLGLGKNDGAGPPQELALTGGTTGLAAFQKGFWQFAKTNCAQCHGASQQPQFALSDLNSSYQYARSSQWINFHDPVNSLFALRAGDGHCGQSSCVGKTSQATPLLSDWAQAELSGGGGGGGGPPPVTFKYMSQPLAVPGTLPTGATFTVMRWQMNALSPAQPLMANSIFELEIQQLNPNTYRVRNPKVVGLAVPVILRGIHILIRKSTDPAPGAEDPLGRNWRNTAVNIQPKPLPDPLPPGPIIDGQILDDSAQGENILSGSDVLTLGFDDLTPGSIVPPLGATFTSVFGNIIQPKCLNCHSAAMAAGGIVLDSFTNVSNSVVPGNPNTSILYTSVVSGNPLMPLNATPLSNTERNAISTWITNGALNN